MVRWQVLYNISAYIIIPGDQLGDWSNVTCMSNVTVMFHVTDISNVAYISIVICMSNVTNKIPRFSLCYIIFNVILLL